MLRKTLAGRAGGVLVAAGSVSDTLYDRALLERRDPATGELPGSTRVGRQPREIAEGAGSLWVVNQASASVSRYDAAGVSASAVLTGSGASSGSLAAGASSVAGSLFAGAAARAPAP